MHSASKDLITHLRRSLQFDVILKTILLCLVCILAVAMPFSIRWMILGIALAGTLIASIYIQVQARRSLPEANLGSQSASSSIRQYLTYYYKYYYRSIYISALSGVYVFIIGAIFYYLYKYGGIPSLGLEDIAILGALIILNFIIGSVAHLKSVQFRIRQLEARAREIEEDTFSSSSIAAYHRTKKRVYLLTGLLFILGLLLLMCVLYAQTQ
jgi:hypothetical protein